jgi:hypothetical protein
LVRIFSDSDLEDLFTVETGKAYQIRDIIHGRFYYPRDPGMFYSACKFGGVKLSCKPKMDWERPQSHHGLSKRERSANGSS